jgi:hypothetical protein
MDRCYGRNENVSGLLPRQADVSILPECAIPGRPNAEMQDMRRPIQNGTLPRKDASSAQGAASRDDTASENVGRDAAASTARDKGLAGGVAGDGVRADRQDQSPKVGDRIWYVSVASGTFEAVVRIVHADGRLDVDVYSPGCSKPLRISKVRRRGEAWEIG